MTLAHLDGLVLVGAGRMGGALLEGWLARGLGPSAVTVIDPNPPAETADAARNHGVRITGSADGLGEAAIVVLAVKPQIMADVLATLGPLVGSGTLALSIAAGRNISDITTGLGRECAVVRVMPNTPAAIGRGISVLVANALVSGDQRAAAGDLMAAVGAVEWVEDEGLMDAVTAVSGSGPAYVFHLVECLAQAGEAVGLDAGLAGRLARETVVGAGALIGESDLAPSRLRENVTSPGGTTEAALEVLMAEDGLASLMRRAVEAATRRGRELSG